MLIDHRVRLSVLHRNVKWNQVIINFMLFQIATQKRPHSLNTDPQTSRWRFLVAA